MEGEGKIEAAARRQFLFDTAKVACGVGMLGLGLGLYTQHARALPPTAIRPPGARAEPQFLGACIRCGMCVRDCPYHILDLAKLEQDTATGTPYFVARSGPCEMCEDIPCVKACPTGALDPKLTDINRARMGLAVLVDHETCLNFLGLRCDVCYRVCPLIDKAITLEQQRNPAPASTRCSSRPCTPISAPVAASARRRACWKPRRSGCCRATWRKASLAGTTASAGKSRGRRANRSSRA